MKIVLIALANSSPCVTLDNLVGVANTFAIGEDGWALIPYGDSLHNGAIATRANALSEVSGKPGVIQRFTRARAEGMASAFHSLRGKIKRAVIGYNLYKGHPDCAAFANLFPDKTPRGTIADMQARADGLALKFVLNEQGAADVEAGYGEFSPYWLAAPVGVDEQGRKIVEPTILKSVGLVTKGNIPGLSLVNAAPDSLSQPNTTTMKEQLLALLALLGITVPPDTADEALAAYVDQAKAALQPKIEAEAELPAANARATAAELKATEATTALANAQSEATAAREAAQAVRSAAASAVVTAAIATGRVPAAQREVEVTALANAADFAAAAGALAARQPTLPTQSRLGDLSQTGKEQQSRQEQLLGLVNTHMATAKCSYDDAFRHVSGTDAGKAIIAGMKKPGATA